MKKDKKTKKTETAPRSKKERESIAWFEKEWTKAVCTVDRPKEGGPLPFISALAQLSYENKRLRERMEIAERLLFSMSTGMVRGLDGNPHLLSCAVREGKGFECDCGSVPVSRKEQA